MTLTLNLERPVSYYPQLARALGSPEAAIYIQQLYYWSDKGHREDGYIYKTKDDIEEETALSRDRQDNIRKKAESTGILHTKLIKANGSPTLHYKLDIQRLQDLISGNSVSRETHYSNRGKPTIPITENTTENTLLVTKVTRASPKKENQSYVLNRLNEDDDKSSGYRGELENGNILGGVDFLTTIPVDNSFGDSSINEILSFFEEQFELKLKRLVHQRRAANRLLKHYGKDIVEKGIKAADIIRDEEYAPQILSLEDLWNKWDKLEAFYRKKKAADKAKVGRITIIEDE